MPSERQRHRSSTLPNINTKMPRENWTGTDKTMNKNTCMLMLLMFTSLMASGQESNKRDSYVNFNYVGTTLEQKGVMKLDSKAGCALSHGHTYYLHKKPIANCLYFGIDVTWLDLTYTNYKDDGINNADTYNSDSKNKNIHEGEISLPFGPSITVNPVGKLNIQAYFKFAPSFSMLYANDDFHYNYAPFFIGGGVISYGIIGIGIESRFGNCKYKILSESDDNEFETSSDKVKTTFSGFRAYLSLRF